MKWRFREVCFLDLGSCSLSALDSDAQYSARDPSDLDMVKIEALDYFITLHYRHFNHLNFYIPYS